MSTSSVRYLAWLGAAALVIGLLWFLLVGLLGPQEWSTAVPGEPDLSVRVRVQNLGLRDDHDQTTIIVREDPWLAPATDTEVGRFDSQHNGPYHPTGFRFEWPSPDQVRIYARLPKRPGFAGDMVEPPEQLLTVVWPLRRRAQHPAQAAGRTIIPDSIMSSRRW